MRILLGIFLAFLVSCSSPERLEYSFFIAGHAYGDPNDRGRTKGLYQPFKNKFEFLNNQKKLKFGVFLNRP